MKVIGLPLVLLVLFYLSFSVYSHHQNLLLSVYDFLVTSNSKLGRFAFFVVFSFITVVISLGSSKTSEADFEGFFSQTSLLYESISNNTTIDIDDKFQFSNYVDDNEHQVYYGSDEDNNEDINSDDIGSEEDDDDDENDTDNEHKGYDGSDEDNNEDINSDDIGSKEDDDGDENDSDNEMEKRAEEFIAKVKQKWREELLTDRLLCITSA